MTGNTDIPAVPPEVAACLERLEAAGAQEGAVTLRDANGTCVEYRLEDGEVQRYETGTAAEEPVVLSALRQSLASEFGGLSGKLTAEVSRPAPDLDSIETALRDGVHSLGTAGLKAMLEEADKQLPVPDCDTCGARMEILGYHGKTFTCRLGKVTVRRRRVQCRDCRNGHYPLDRHLGIEGEGVTPGAASVIADIVKDELRGLVAKAPEHGRDRARLQLDRSLGKEEFRFPAKVRAGRGDPRGALVGALLCID